MSLFDRLGNGKPVKSGMPDKNEMQKMVRQLQANPVGFLQEMGYNVPNNLNNPNDIISFLMQSNQINGGLLSKAQQLLKLFI